jgi:hypothetical protein
VRSPSCSLERATDARERAVGRPLVQHHEYLASLQTATISQDRNHSLAEATDFTDSKTSDRDLDESEVLEPEKETQALDGQLNLFSSLKTNRLQRAKP